MSVVQVVVTVKNDRVLEQLKGYCMSYKRIRIRDDDVLVSSSSFTGKEFERFRGFHNMVKEDPKHFVHVLAILATEIRAFPECIDFIKEETAKGTMFPEVHGLHHIDYASLPYEAVVAQLSEAKQFIIDNFNYTPTLWYSPWGAGADARGAHLRPAAIDAGLNLVTCVGMIQPSKLINEIRAIENTTTAKKAIIERWAGSEILRHWWEGSGALMESIKFFKENDP